MKLELRSLQNVLLELEIEDIRPRINIGEILIDGRYYPWHGVWENLKIKEFLETNETVKNKVISFYKAETESSRDSQGIVKRMPGTAKLITDDECWELKNCKIVDTRLEPNLWIELAFDGASYKNKKTS
jgi:hypothetical protein